jgi:acid phosphatase (class A)
VWRRIETVTPLPLRVTSLRFVSAAFIACGLLLPGSAVAGSHSLKHLDPVALLPPPPVPGSAEDRADLENSARIHAAAPAEDLRLAVAETRLTFRELIPAEDVWWNSGPLPKTEALFARAEAVTRKLTNVAKEHARRLRPYQVAPARFPRAVEHDAPFYDSYPSGHATRGTVFAAILGELWPAQRDAFFARGREAGWLRVEGGVHYASDVYAGRVLGQAIAQALFADAGFQRDLQAAKQEVTALAAHEAPAAATH